MSKVLISHSNVDAAVAGAVKARLSSIETTAVLDWTTFKPELNLADSLRNAIQQADLVVVLWSERSAGSLWLRQETQLALEAWEDNRLLLVRLDSTLPPLGLRDVECLDVSQAAGTSAVELIAARVGIRLSPDAPPSPAAGRNFARGPGAKPLLAVGVLVIVCLLVGLLFVSLNAIQEPAPSPPATELPAPGPQPDAPVVPAPAPAEQMSLDLGSPFVIAAPILAILLIALFLYRRFTQQRGRAAAPAVESMNARTVPQPLFISYSHDDSPRVNELVDALQRAGLGTWLDRRQNAGGRRFAGPIVDAIRGSKACAFMCSSTAYASDHVVRELYLADKYAKLMIPIQLENVLPTADFEYFFSGLDFVSDDPTDQCIAAIQSRMVAIEKSLPEGSGSGRLSR